MAKLLKEPGERLLDAVGPTRRHDDKQCRAIYMKVGEGIFCMEMDSLYRLYFLYGSWPSLFSKKHLEEQGRKLSLNKFIGHKI